MAQPFSFGFSGDDIEVDAHADQVSPAVPATKSTASVEAEAAQLPAQAHDVAELVCAYFAISYLMCLESFTQSNYTLCFSS